MLISFKTEAMRLCIQHVKLTELIIKMDNSILVKKLSEAASIPQRGSEGAAGLDISSCAVRNDGRLVHFSSTQAITHLHLCAFRLASLIVPAKSWTTVPTGLALAVPLGVRPPVHTVCFNSEAHTCVSCADVRKSRTTVGPCCKERD